MLKASLDGALPDEPAAAGTILALAVYGWSCASLPFGSPPSTDGTSGRYLLACRMCQREIPAWDYLMVGASMEARRRRRRMSREGKEVFDPIEEHRSYCLWVRSGLRMEGQDTVEAVTPGWQATTQGLLGMGSTPAFMDPKEGQGVSVATKVQLGPVSPRLMLV